MRLTQNAETVLKKRYLWTGESPEQLFLRVADAVARAEKKSNQRKQSKKFLQLMQELRFLPNSPTLMNAGREGGQLSACFVLPVEDSLDKIFDSLKHAALIHQSGGGTGFSFSRLRAKGSTLFHSNGSASGPVSFMRVFDAATDQIKQGGTRRGANMGILRVDHPDIEEFIQCKRDGKSIVNFNISVGITDEFMQTLVQGGPFSLKDPRNTSKSIGVIDSERLWNLLIKCAWESGDPGVIFLDRINRFNPTPRLGEMESTNPCGEQPLLPYESCNLGSMNLKAYLKSNLDLDWSTFGADIETAVRFLDNVVELNTFPVKACELITHKNRKIGLGVMGFADVLLKMGVPYDSLKARTLGEEVMCFLDQTAKRASHLLAKERGVAPGFKGSMWERLGCPKLRNMTVSTVAPTGTISVLAGVSSGIEPIYSAAFFRNVLDGARLVDLHPAVQEYLFERGIKPEKLDPKEVEQKIEAVAGKAWSPAQKVSVEGHVLMQAAFQRHSDSAVSKTINLNHEAKPKEIDHAYRLAYAQGCKGITVYRDGSKPTQVLERIEPEAAIRAKGGEVCPSC